MLEIVLVVLGARRRSENVDYLFASTGPQGSEQLYAGPREILKKACQLDTRSGAITHQMATTYTLMHQYEDAAAVPRVVMAISIIGAT